MWTRKRLIVGAAMVVTLALAVLALWALNASDRGPIRYENYEKIQPGMTRGDVVRLLGCASGDYSTGPVHARMHLADGSLAFTQVHAGGWSDVDPPFGNWNEWLGDSAMVAVAFDNEDRVIRKDFYTVRRLPPAWWLAVERTLGLDR